MTNEELLQAFSYRLEGLTFQDISEKLGYSKQNIQHELSRVLTERKVSKRFRTEWFKNRPELARIILNQYRSLTNFCKATGCDYRSLQGLLQGTLYPYPKVMKRLIDSTGLQISTIFENYCRINEIEDGGRKESEIQ